MAQQPRRRIAPIPVAPQVTTASAFQPSSATQSSVLQPAQLEYSNAPSTLPGRRMKFSLGESIEVDYRDLLKKNGVDPKALNAKKKAAAADPKPGPARDGLPPLPGFPRMGPTSPGAVGGGKSMFGSVVDRLERIYSSAAADDEEDEDEDEGSQEDEGDEEDDSEASASDSSEAEDDAEGG
ncbi:hypothetical protein Agub_g787, partial [Astrephomene gubernaculifera]